LLDISSDGNEKKLPNHEALTYIFSLLFLCTIFKAWTLCNHPVVTSFVDDTSAHLTLVALLSQSPAKAIFLGGNLIFRVELTIISPYEVPAVRAERWLSQECCHELVSVYLVDFSSHRTPPTIETLSLLELARLLHDVFCKFKIANPISVQH
jgi:hypothetical protein